MIRGKFDLLPARTFPLALDLGCGPGENLSRLGGIARDVVAIDVDAGAMRAARDRVADARILWLLADVASLPLRPASADLVVLSEVLEHCREEPRVIEEIRRVLRPGGLLLLTTPHRGPFAVLDPLNFNWYFPRLYAWLGLAAKRKRKGEHPFHRHYRLPELRRLLDGFEITRVHRGGLLVHPLVAWIDAAVVKLLARRVPERWRRRLYRLAAWEGAVPFGTLAYDVWLTARRC